MRGKEKKVWEGKSGESGAEGESVVKIRRASERGGMGGGRGAGEIGGRGGCLVDDVAALLEFALGGIHKDH